MEDLTMKKIFRLFPAALAVIVFASCADKMGSDINVSESDVPVQEGNLVQMTFSASMGEDVDSKTTYSRRKVYWEASDAITVFSVGENVTKTPFSDPELLENGAVARFSGVADASAETYYAVYPHSEANTYDNGTFSVVFPHTHVAVANGFPSGSNVSVAVSEKDAETTGQNLQFMNVGALLAFSFADLETAWNTASVAFKAKKSDTEYWRLAGATTLTLDENDLPVAAEGDVQAVVVNAPDGGFKTGVTYYIPVIPVGACTGMELVYTDLNGVTYTKKNDVGFELLRSYMFNVGKLPKPYAITLPEGDVTLVVDFSTVWPFVERMPDAVDGKVPAMSYAFMYEITSKNQFVPLYFKFTEAKNISYSSRFTYNYDGDGNNGQVLNLTLGTGHGLKITLPGISGKYLKSVKAWVCGRSNKTFKVLEQISSSATNLSSGDTAAELVFPVENQNTEEGVAYEMTSISGNNNIRKLEITYTEDAPTAE